MAYVLIEFVNKWIEEGRFPREELRIRWWIAALGIFAVLAVVLAIIFA